MLRNSISAITNAHIDSTTTTALGTIIGSCLPFIVISSFSLFLFTVSCFNDMDGVGLNAARITISLPSEIPPSIPPALLDSLTIFQFSFLNGSLFSEPLSLEAPNPAPISTPFTAPNEKSAFPSSASSLSKTGSPIPAGTPLMIHSATLFS